MFLRQFVALSLIAFSSTALADSVDINLRDNSAQVQYNASMGKDTLADPNFMQVFCTPATTIRCSISACWCRTNCRRARGHSWSRLKGPNRQDQGQ